MDYKKTEIGIPILLFTIPWIIGILSAFLFGSPDVAFKFIFGAFLLVNLCILAWLPSMTITVDDERVAWKFGIGLTKGHIPLEKINKVEEVEDTKQMGFGARTTTRGVLYSVHFKKAVRLHVQTPWTKDKIIELGTSEPAVLKEVIERKAGLKNRGENQLPAAEQGHTLDAELSREEVSSISSESPLLTKKRHRS